MNDRRKNHAAMILDLLQNNEQVYCSVFAVFSRNHTARISELRNEGYDIECQVLDEDTGETVYRLKGKGEPREARRRQVTRDQVIAYLASCTWVEIESILADVRTRREGKPYGSTVSAAPQVGEA